MDYVQVPKQDLIQYVDKVNRLIEDHDKQTQELSDIRALADIVNETWQVRLDALADLILDRDPLDNDLYERGLIKAYEIMKGSK
jgi:hypothetical protein